MNSQPSKHLILHNDSHIYASIMSSYITAVVAIMGLLFALASSKVGAVPSFARQTGMQCSSCHTLPRSSPVV